MKIKETYLQYFFMLALMSKAAWMLENSCIPFKKREKLLLALIKH